MHPVDTGPHNDCNTQMGKGARSRLARKLRMLRVVRGWSQEELADASGLHRTSISLIERSACNISLDSLERLAKTFDVSLPDLLGAMDPADVGKRLLATLNKTVKKKRGRRVC